MYTNEGVEEAYEEIIMWVHKKYGSSREEKHSGYVRPHIENSNMEKIKKDIQSRNIKTIMITGKFGTGKTSLLDELLEDVDEENVLKIEFYSEFIEENYVDMLYNKSFGKYKQNIFKLNTILVFVFMIIMTNFNEIYSMPEVQVNIEKFIKFLYSFGSLAAISIIILLIALVTYIFFYPIFQSKLYENLFYAKNKKLNTVKKYLGKFEYIVIDDLDRVYLDRNSEVLKMIHFISTEVVTDKSKSKLILVGDKEKFKEKNIDMLEKYYDFVITIPKSFPEKLCSEYLLTLHNQLRSKNENEYGIEDYSSLKMESVKKYISTLPLRTQHLIFRQIFIEIENEKTYKKMKSLYFMDIVLSYGLYFDESVNYELLMEELHVAKEMAYEEYWLVYEHAVTNPSANRGKKLNLKLICY